MTKQRYDFVQFKAEKTDEGFLKDSPIVGRTGIQEYIREDGTVFKELRLPEEVFHADALASMQGKPITLDHKLKTITAKNANRVTIGTVLSAGREDGETVRTDIVIHSPDEIGTRRELSLGYNCDVDEIAGEHPVYGKYDGIQRNIRINHLSVVKRGRAGVARLNLDGNEVVEDDNFNQKEQGKMTVKVKLDNGIEYEAAPEVAAELTKLRADALEAAKKLEATKELTAKIDELQAKVDGTADLVTKAKQDGKDEAFARLKLESVADKFKIDHKDKTDREVKEAIVKSVRKDADLTGKSDVYLDAAFDIALEVAPDLNMASQREAVNTKTDSAVSTSKSAYADYMAKLANKEIK